MERKAVFLVAALATVFYQIPGLLAKPGFESHKGSNIGSFFPVDGETENTNIFTLNIFCSFIETLKSWCNQNHCLFEAPLRNLQEIVCGAQIPAFDSEDIFLRNRPSSTLKNIPNGVKGKDENIGGSVGHFGLSSALGCFIGDINKCQELHMKNASPENYEILPSKFVLEDHMIQLAFT
ncbi:Hypothetical protein NTJ_03628 [Nesidiocoris tenuis]|uniref:Uncharacterized protein n=1 Tax=Nesidiocoris tenuis TaxID=355587 RepID=A0ABN7AEW3_9HEMI|nr:Hypothetical protein NTJ_03628 [Nesidiocoris tenuis]